MIAECGVSRAWPRQCARPSGVTRELLRGDTDADTARTLYRHLMRWSTVAVAAGWVACIASTAFCVFAIPGSVSVYFVVSVVVGLVPLVFATVVARARPGHPASALLAAASAGLLVPATLPTDPPSPFMGLWMLLYLPFALLLLVVPDTRPLSPHWGRLGPWITAVTAAFILVDVAQWAWPAWEVLFIVAGLILLAIFLGLLFACAAAPIARYRASDDETRLRLRWVFLAGASLPLTLLTCWASYLVLGTPELVAIGLVVMYLGIPAGTTIALVRPRLFDIDRALVATVAAEVLFVAVLVILSVTGAISGTPLVQWPALPLIAIAVGLTLAVVFGYPHTCRVVDRLLYPERARGLAAIHRFSGEVDAGRAQPEDLETTLRDALRDPDLRVGYRRASQPGLIGLDGAPLPAGEHATWIHVRAEEIGALVPSPSRVNGPPSAVADAVAPVVDAIRLRAELSAAMVEVEASRSRILRAGYDERRRLERDLHDGAQQRLVALGMRLRVLQRGSTTDAALAATLDTAVADLGTTVAELRRIAHGLRPSALDDGLGPALAALTQLAPGTIELEVHAGDLPDAIATTAYFVASEAVTNALRHADASRIRVSVRRRADALVVSIDDDGCGGATAKPSGGLAGLADRVAALGGRFAVAAGRDAGTVIEAELPCGS